MIESLKKLIAPALKAQGAISLSEKDFDFILKNNPVLSKYKKEILDAHLYPLCASGKFIRPLLVLLTAGSLNPNEETIQSALSAALSVEYIHTYSLVHDDLPCMDNDTLRRGQPTTHVIFGDAKAMLVGDGLLTGAFELLSRDAINDTSKSNLSIQLIHSLSRACGSRGMIFGQWLDISEAEFLNAYSLLPESDQWNIFHTIHKNKTGKLFGACFEMGFLCGMHQKQNELHSAELYSLEQGQVIKNKLFQIGLDFGISFQIIDDILDATQNSDVLGKTAGKDRAQNKLSAVKIFGLEKASEYAKKYQDLAIKNLREIFETNFICDIDNHYYENLLLFLNSLLARQK